MAGKSNKTVQPDDVLRSVFMAGLLEMQRAGIEVRVGNTGQALVVVIEVWRLCPACAQVVQAGDMASAVMCQECAADAARVLAPA